MFRPFALGATPYSPPTAQTQSIRTVNANTTLTATDFGIRVNTTAGNVTITLPTGAAYQGMIYNIKKIAAANTLVIASAHNIDGQSSLNITANNASTALQYDFASTSWNIL